MSNSTRISRRLKLLASVSVAILAPNAVLAAEVLVTDTSVDSDILNSFDLATRGFESVFSDPLNSARVSAVVTATGGITRTDTWNGSTTSSSNAATTNQIAATAIGNTFSNIAPLTVLDSNLLADGIASSGVAVNTGYVTSLVEGSDITVSLVNTPLDSSTNSSNSITATTAINKGVTTVSGQVPNTYTSATGGSGFINQYASSYETVEAGVVSENFVDGDGSVVLSTLQHAERNVNDSFASVADNNVLLDLSSTADLTMSGSGTLDDNTVGASFTGNSSTSVLGVEGGANPAFTGSAVVVTSQTYAGNDSEATNNASNWGTDIQADVYSSSVFESEVYTLTGSLTVDGNSILSSATGNASIGNALTLDGGINLAGSTNGAVAYSNDTGGFQETSGTGSLVVASNQLVQDLGSNFGSVTSSGVYEATISGYVDNIAGGSLSVSNNTISSVARNNSYSGQIATSQNVTSVDGGVAFSTLQSAEASDVDSDVQDSLLEAKAGQNWWNGIEGGSLTVLDNVISAGAYGNQADHQISLEATSLNSDVVAAARLEATTEGFAYGSGSVILSSEQSLWGSSVNARNTGSRIVANADDDEATDTSTVIVGGNRQEAVAVSNLGTNGIDLAATTVGSGVGIVSLQKVDAISDTVANFQGSANIYIAEDVGDGAGASTVSLIDNTQRAVAYGNSAGNDLTIEATTANVQVSWNEASEVDLYNFASNSTTAAYSVLNTQLAQSDVSANVGPNGGGWSQFELYVGLDVQDGSAAVNDRNTALSAAYGNQAINSGSLAVNSISTDTTGVFFGEDRSGVANVTSGQYLDASETLGMTVQAQISPNGDAGVLTYVSEDLFGGSSVSTSTNALQAQATGNLASNSLDVVATQITAVDGYVSLNDGADMTHGFSVNNAQSADYGTVVRSTLRDDFIEPFASSEIRTYVGGDITDSSAVSLGNILLASAGTNRADNGLTVTTTGLEATVGLNNTQVTRGDTIASIGLEGTAATAGAPEQTVTNSAGGSGTMSISGDNVVVAGAPVTLTFATPLTAAQAAYLNNQPGYSGATLGGTSVTVAVGTASTLFWTNFRYNSGVSGSGTGDETLQVDGFIIPASGGSLGIPASGGVYIDAGASIANSTVRVDGNTAKGMAIGNDATNSLLVNSTLVSNASLDTRAQTYDSYVDANIALGNWQDAQETSSSIATVISSFHVNQAANNSITDSLVSVSGNKQSATAVANLADSTLVVNATDLASSPTTIGLGSAQTVWSDFENAVVDANSVMEVYAPIQSTGSTITMNDNSNRAVGIFNDAINMLSITGTNIGSISDMNANYSGGAVASDFGLENSQWSSGNLSTEARTNIYNQDLVDAATNGVIDGTVEVNGNLTFAEATANRSDNSGSVNGTANQGASVGLANIQGSSSTVDSLAVTTATITLAGTNAVAALDDRAALNSSSASMDGNATQALARGNSAINALESLAGATYPALANAGAPGSLNGTVDAAAFVRNRQDNTGQVTATARASYTVVLNTADGAPSVSSSTVSLANNSVVAVAYGNQAVNQLTLTPLNSGLATGAVNSTQYNGGYIRAEATSVTFQISSAAGTSNASSFRTAGNAVTATAVGNSVTSAIIGR